MSGVVAAGELDPTGRILLEQRDRIDRLIERAVTDDR
jgi:hypothetical protein